MLVWESVKFKRSFMEWHFIKGWLFFYDSWCCLFHSVKKSCIYLFVKKISYGMEVNVGQLFWRNMFSEGKHFRSRIFWRKTTLFLLFGGTQKNYIKNIFRCLLGKIIYTWSAAINLIFMHFESPISQDRKHRKNHGQLGGCEGREIVQHRRVVLCCKVGVAMCEQSPRGGWGSWGVVKGEGSAAREAFGTSGQGVGGGAVIGW